MTRIRVWRYICDYCGKRSLSGGHMSCHEKYCTANPNRICRMHAHFDEPQRSIIDLMMALNSQAEDHGMTELRKRATNCPMCILAAIRQSGIQKWDGDIESPPLNLGFDFKVELKSAWQTINEAKAQNDPDYSCY